MEIGAFQTLAKALARMDEQDRKLLLSMAGYGATGREAVANRNRCLGWIQ
jgi:hypothetical protein